jgi:hypothetical protein
MTTKEHLMKRIQFAVVSVLAAVAAVAVMQGCDVLGGPPTNVQVAAETDSTIQVAWSAPSEGNPDKYMVNFKPVRESTFAVLGEATGTSYQHKPYGITGTYKVTAVFGADTYEATVTPTTVPVHTDSMTLYELNVDTLSGYGWSRTTGEAAGYSMQQAASAAGVDFYITDLLPDHVRLPYVVASPDIDTLDSGNEGVVPSAAWHTNGFSNPVYDEQASLPAFTSSPSNYFNYTEIPTPQTLVGCYTAGDDEGERHYALIKVLAIDGAVGKVQLETWFQLVPGLRLMKH